MSIRKIIAVILNICVLMVSLSTFTNFTSFAETTTDELFDYLVSSNYITITKYRGSQEQVIIPETIDGLPVLEIGNDAFTGNQVIKKVTANSVTIIQDGRITPALITVGSFAYCSNLTEIIMPTLQTVGILAFKGSGLVSINLPEVTTIYSNAFEYNQSLTTVTAPKVTTIYDEAFSSCTLLTNINMPIVNRIEAFSFRSCSALTEIHLPKLTIVGGGAFYSCTTLETVDLPKATNIYTKKQMWPSGQGYNYYGVFGNCTSLVSIELPEAIIIGEYTFMYCSVLKEVFVLAASSLLNEGAFAYQPNTGNGYGLKCPALENVYVSCGYSFPTYTIGYSTFKKIHDSNWITTKTASCTEDGIKERNCSNCSEIETEAITKLGHLFTENFTVDVEATCTEDGRKSHHCSRCDAISDVTAISMTGHVWGNWITTKTASYTEDGRKERTCSNCNEIETKVIKKLTAPKTVPVSSVTISNPPKTMIIGNGVTLKASVLPANATKKTITWESSDTKIATVNKTTGAVTAKGAGTVKITAKADGKSKTCSITVHSYVTLKIGSTKAIQNGTKTTIDSVGTKPFKINGKTMLPLRFVGEKMGGKVKYINDSKPITMSYGNTIVEFKLGDKRMKVITGKTTKTVTLDVPAQKIKGKTYIPLRAIGQALGFHVYYQSGTEYIIINTPKMSSEIQKARLDEAKAYIK